VAPDGLRPAAANAAATGNWQPLPSGATQVTLFTSGSTGDPVALPKQLSQLDAEVRALEAAFGERLPAGCRLLSTVSHQHIYGLLFCVLWPLAAGRPLGGPKLDYHDAIARACHDGPSCLVSSPAHLRRVPAELDWTGARRHLAAVFSSGGPLPAAAGAEVQARLGQSPVEVYGSSETGGIAWRQASRHGARWTPLPGVQWRLEDGFLSVCSDHLPTPGWHLCADCAQPSGDDTFVLTGRADRIIKIEAKRISLSLVERTLCASPLVSDARALMLDLAIGARLGAVLALSAEGRALLAADGRTALVAALRQALLQAVDPLALPRRWAFPETLPCNAQGKTTEHMLRDQFRRTLPATQWLERSPTHAVALLDVDAGLAAFDGHFAQVPILPGVAQVDWAARLAAQVLPVPPASRFHRLDALKFLQVIRPGCQLRLELDWQAERHLLAFTLSSDAGRHATGRIVYRSADAEV
jgi:acyl-coenzyme A synthetase/AMP-(fatty) acid ligase/3-hydroxymyristoyl/3-hydroxydecanoyl-(acyl carrier protein) dehydratase